MSVLDEAEAAARDLLRRFPDVHDGWNRLGMVHEARGARTTSHPVDSDISTAATAQDTEIAEKVFTVSATHAPAPARKADARTTKPKLVNTATAAPTAGPKALPVNVTQEPADGVNRENRATVLVRNKMTTIATSIVKTAATPAPCTITAKPKKSSPPAR